MKTTRRSFSLGVAGFTLATSMAIVPRGMAAQESTPAATDMGNAVTALGIGEEGDAVVNVVHASPDAPAVDVYVDGEQVLTGLAFGEYSGWVALPAGEHQIQVTPEGAEPGDAVIDTTVTVEAGVAYEIAATGLLEEITPQIYPVDLSMLEDEMARFRVIHASPDAPAVDIAVADGDVLIEGLEFPNASDYLEVPAGTYDLEVRPAGTTDVALDLPGVELEAGMVYDVFAIGQLEDETLMVLIVPATTTAAQATPAS
ncbi:MAG: DUF4397 domain-containing protein [Chloroflexota bacterium]|nr:DUF4397 domain-containing protein [Chloroflexota bacterium]